MDEDYTRYKNARDMLQQTGWDVEKALSEVEAELRRLKH